MVSKHLANGISAFPIKSKPVFSNASRGLPPDMLHKENVVWPMNKSFKGALMQIWKSPYMFVFI